MNRDETERMYEAHYMRIFSYAMTLSGDRTLAEEITQETFFRAFSKRGEYRKEADEVTWLCAIAKNLFYDEKRRQRRNGPMPEEMPDAGESLEQAAADVRTLSDRALRLYDSLSVSNDFLRQVIEMLITRSK